MRLVIADDHRIVRDGLRWILEGSADVELVGEAESGPELVQLLEHTPADVVLLDVRMPGMSGLEALEALRDRLGETKVIILSMHDEPAYVKRAIELGASGYLLKNTGREELLRALAIVAAGGAYVQSEVTATLLEELAGSDRPPATTLSARERQVLGLVAQGYENKQIARELGISEATVKTYVKSIFERLDVRSRAEAVAVGLRLGIIQ